MNYSTSLDRPDAAAHQIHSALGLAPLLSVEVATSLEQITALRSDFSRLETAAANRLPFALFEWQLAWCRHFPRSDGHVTDQPMIHVMRTSAGACVGIVPLILTRRRVGNLTISSIGLTGADPAITEIRTALVQPGFEEAVAATLHARLHSRGEWDWIQWMAAPGAFSSALGRLRQLTWQPGPPSYILDLPPDWESFRAGLKRNIRESLRRCYNSMKRDGIAFQFKVAATPAEVDAALGRLLVLHAMRADMPGTVPHPNRFESASLREFLHDVCRALAERGIARVFELEVGGVVVAARIGFVVGDSLYFYYSGFDPRWARYSVMTTTVAEAIKYAIALRLKTVNLSPGNDVSKTRWGPRELPHLVAYENSGRIRSRMVRHAYVKASQGTGLQGWLLRRLMPGRRHWK